MLCSKHEQNNLKLDCVEFKNSYILMIDVKSHYRASVKSFRLATFCLAFVFSCVADLKSFT